MKTIGEILKLSGEFLAEKKIPQPRRTAEELIGHVLQLKKMELYLQFDKPIIDQELNVIRELLKRAVKGEPIAYILGEVAFFHCRIRVDERVLIPRPETEILVEKMAGEIKQGVLWDLCAGSGCIGIALKKACPALQVTLSDLSPKALALARDNAKMNAVDVRLLEGDLFDPFLGEKADIIVCNPPYISEAEYRTLDPSVKDFEPKMALVAGETGLEFYERLQKELPKYLNPNGKVFFEIGATQGGSLQKLFPQGKIYKDWSNLDRFFSISGLDGCDRDRQFYG